MTNGCKAIVVQEVEDRDSLFTFLVFVCLPSRETSQSRKLDGDVVAVVIAGSGWVLRLPLSVRRTVLRCGETWLPAKLIRRQPPCLGRRTALTIWLSSALPERAGEKRLPLEEGQRQCEAWGMPFAGQEMKQAKFDRPWSR